jgi:hypothetical protein
MKAKRKKQSDQLEIAKRFCKIYLNGNCRVIEDIATGRCYCLSDRFIYSRCL